MSSFRSAALVCAVAASIAVAVVVAHGQSAQGRGRASGPAGPASVAGTGTMYVSSYKGVIFVVDEATEKVVNSIPFKSGIPGRVVFSNDRSKMYVLEIGYEKVEILDRAAGRTLDTFTLSDAKTKTRIWSMQPDPSDKYLMLVVQNYTLQADRWEVGAPTLVQYDLATKKITRTIPWPNGDERRGVSVIFSLDGKLMYLFSDDVLIYDTSNFTQVDKWDLSQPIEPGAGRIGIGGLDPFSDDPGFYTGMFTMADPVENRRIMGIGRVELAKKKLDFHPIGPAIGMQFTITRDHKHGYGLYSGPTATDYAFWAFDLENYRQTSRVPFRGRPRMSMRTSSNGSMLYIYTAGNTIDLYDTATLKLQRTITLDGDMISFTLLPPSLPPPPANR